MSHKEHEKCAADLALSCCVITLSDTRSKDSDTSGQAIIEQLKRAGYRVAQYELIPDEPEQLRLIVRRAIADPEIDLIITTGGTGVAARDRTVDTILPMLGTPIPGFGELFRMLSFQEIGAAAMLSRAEAGIANGTVVFLLPGSTHACKLAMERLIVPQAAHLVSHAKR